MADAGYDVWLVNNRGNCYSRNHVHLDPNAEFGEFWKFSWDDSAFQDFPCIFDYIRSVTQQKQCYFVGNSQGTSQMLAFLAEYPEWNERFYAVSLMAPVAFVSNPKFLWVTGRLLSTYLNRVNVKYWIYAHKSDQTWQYSLRLCMKNIFAGRRCRNISEKQLFAEDWYTVQRSGSRHMPELDEIGLGKR